MSGISHLPTVLPPGKRPGTRCTGGCVGPRGWGRSERVCIISLPPGFRSPDRPFRSESLSQHTGILTWKTEMPRAGRWRLCSQDEIYHFWERNSLCHTIRRRVPDDSRYFTAAAVTTINLTTAWHFPHHCPPSLFAVRMSSSSSAHVLTLCGYSAALLLYGLFRSMEVTTTLTNSEHWPSFAYPPSMSDMRPVPKPWYRSPAVNRYQALGNPKVLARSCDV